jgi:signal transduction histidine kinase
MGFSETCRAHPFGRSKIDLVARDRSSSRSPHLTARSTLVALPTRARQREARVASSRLPTTSASFRAPFLQVGVILLLAMLLGRYAGYPVSVPGAAVAGLVAAWEARRRSDSQLSWAAISVACLIWVAAHVVARVSSLAGAIEVGGVVFAVGIAAGQLLWPELRGSVQRLIATVTDSVTVLASFALWGLSGVVTLGPARPADLLLPFVTALVVAPQLAPARRWSAFGVAGGLGLLLVVGFLGPHSGVDPNNGIVALQALAFVVMVAALVVGQAGGPSLNLLDHDRNRPPFLIPGLIGAAGLVMALVELDRATSLTPVFALIVGACLGVREVLRVTNRREAYDRLASSLDLETQLLTLQAASTDAVVPEATLDRSCGLAAEVLKGSATLAWLVESDALVLRSVGGPSAPEGLLGRRLPLAESRSLAARVIRTAQWEVCDAALPSARVDRFLTTLLDVGPILGVPIHGDEGPSGVLVIVRPRGEAAFTHWDQQKGALIAAQVGATLRHIELQDELEHQLREATLVHRFAIQAGSARSTNDVAWLLLESIRSQMPIDRASVYLADASHQASLTPIAYFPTRAPDRPTRFGQVHLRVPLRHGESTVGYVELHRSESAPFSSKETRVADTLGHQAAIAMQNLRLQVESGKVSTYRELDRLKTDLLNAVSHDLRGPLANIKGYAATLVDTGNDMSPEEQRFFLETIEEESDRLRDLLNHLLDLSKIEAGVLKVEMQPLNVERMVTQTLASVQEQNRQYETRISGDLAVMGDGRRLRQVLHNLLENAAKYSPDGGPITVCAAETGGEVVISVADSGVGIPRHQWDRVFRPYQRADTATSRGISGNGLGLAICKGIIEAHGGRIWVESEPGTGTMFSFTVPVARGLPGVSDVRETSRLNS